MFFQSQDKGGTLKIEGEEVDLTQPSGSDDDDDEGDIGRDADRGSQVSGGLHTKKYTEKKSKKWGYHNPDGKVDYISLSVQGWIRDYRNFLINCVGDKIGSAHKGNDIATITKDLPDVARLLNAEIRVNITKVSEEVGYLQVDLVAPKFLDKKLIISLCDMQDEKIAQQKKKDDANKKRRDKSRSKKAAPATSTGTDTGKVSISPIKVRLNFLA